MGHATEGGIPSMNGRGAWHGDGVRVGVWDPNSFGAKYRLLCVEVTLLYLCFDTLTLTVTRSLF